MSDQVVLAMGWSSCIDREVLRMQMMELADGERPMVREFRVLLVSVTDRNEAEFMSRFQQLMNIDQCRGLGFKPFARHWWKVIGILLLRKVLLLPLVFLGFSPALKVVPNHGTSHMRITENPIDGEKMFVNGENVGFVSLGRRKNNYDPLGGEMR